MTAATPAAPTAPSALAEAVDLRLDEGYDQAAQADLDTEIALLASKASGHRWPGTPEELLERRAALAAQACGVDPHTDQLCYTTVDFLSWHAREVEEGCTLTKIGPDTIEKLCRVQIVPNARLRERFAQLEAGGDLTVTQLALRLGHGAKRGQGDTTYVKRMLGMAHFKNRSGKRSLRMFVSYDQAVALADALGMTYHDLGV